MHGIAPEAIALKVLESKTAIIDKPSRVLGLGIDILVSATPIYHQNELLGVISVFKDISEVKILTKELNNAREFAKYLQEELTKKNGPPAEFGLLIGKNSKFIGMLHQAAKVAKTDCTVLIRGESGVGKEILATAIHNVSPRKNKPIIRVNCAAIPENLFESELFGYEEGAFTGAHRGGKPGKFELANGGTLFLDEIGDLSPNLQAKLLRAIQEKEIERLGSIKSVRTNVRLIAATNQNLEAGIKDNTFRKDLFYRLNNFSLVIPALRERKDDIFLLAGYFLEKFNRNYGKNLNFSTEVLQIFYDYSWPGNIRELQNVIEHAIVISEGLTLQLKDLPPYLQAIPYSKKSMSFYNVAEEKNFTLPSIISLVEKKVIEDALHRAKGNKSEAMKSLGISRATFYSKLKQYFPEVLHKGPYLF